MRHYGREQKGVIIYKVLNNNAVIVRNEKGVEEVICGKGIAYKKKAGYFLPDNGNYQIFVMHSKDLSHKLQQLIEEIPLEQLTLSSKIIDYAKLHLGKPLNESIYISLSDHIHTSIIRYKEGISLKNVIFLDIKHFYPDEFRIGEKALEMINKKLGISLPEDEAGFLAIHFINAEMDENFDNTLEIIHLIQDISSIVKYVFSIEFDEDDVYYYRFITHLKFFAQRVISKKTYQESDDELLEIVQKKYPAAFSCVEKIDDYLQKKYAYQVPCEEQAYLTIHIQRVVYKTKQY